MELAKYAIRCRNFQRNIYVIIFKIYNNNSCKNDLKILKIMKKYKGNF